MLLAKISCITIPITTIVVIGMLAYHSIKKLRYYETFITFADIKQLFNETEI
jgi:hypothetical protein